jgi:hypothetical protein
MRIDATEFGAVTIDAKTYEHDVIIRLSGKVEKRRKRLSKEKYGTSHIVSKEEAKFVFEDGCEVLIVGAGQDGNVRLSPEASTYFDKKRCRVILQPAPEAIVSFNRSRDKKIALIPSPVDGDRSSSRRRPASPEIAHPRSSDSFTVNRRDLMIVGATAIAARAAPAVAWNSLRSFELGESFNRSGVICHGRRTNLG